MECSVFKKKLNDYIEGNLKNDLKSAMDRHIEECEECKSSFKSEMDINSHFEDALKINTNIFKSGRINIMSNINKNLYGNKRNRKAMNSVVKHKFAYMAGVLAIFFTMGAYGTVKIINEKNSKNNVVIDKNLAKDILNNTSPASDGENYENGYKFELTKGNITMEPEFGSEWAKSQNGTFEISIDGKGPDVSEEGVAKILVRNYSKNEMDIFSLVDSSNQKTPLSCFVKDESKGELLAIVGSGYGRISTGGDVYLLNVNSGDSKRIYECQNSNEMVESLTAEGNNVKLSIKVFTDEEFSNFTYREENITVQ